MLNMFYFGTKKVGDRK